jgi:hypothetical protein
MFFSHEQIPAFPANLSFNSIFFRLSIPIFPSELSYFDCIQFLVLFKFFPFVFLSSGQWLLLFILYLKVKILFGLIEENT